MIVEASVSKSKKMDWSEYAALYANQTLKAMGDTRPAPRNWLDLIARFDASLYESAYDRACELFGTARFDSSEPSLYEVEELTIKETTIASRMDLTHAEKIEGIKPLREARRAKSEAHWNRQQEKQTAKREALIAIATESAMVITDDDRALAAQMGIKLD